MKQKTEVVVFSNEIPVNFPNVRYVYKLVKKKFISYPISNKFPVNKWKKTTTLFAIKRSDKLNLEWKFHSVPRFFAVRISFCIFFFSKILRFFFSNFSEYEKKFKTFRKRTATKIQIIKNLRAENYVVGMRLFIDKHTTHEQADWIAHLIHKSPCFNFAKYAK